MIVTGRLSQARPGPISWTDTGPRQEVRAVEIAVLGAEVSGSSAPAAARVRRPFDRRARPGRGPAWGMDLKRPACGGASCPGQGAPTRCSRHAPRRQSRRALESLGRRPGWKSISTVSGAARGEARRGGRQSVVKGAGAKAVGAVVQVALETAPLLIAGVHQRRATGLHLVQGA
jgi:hypothetical protein